MKKFLSILFFVALTTNAFSQQVCQAYFTYSYNPGNTTLLLFDHSYNVDSTQINITSWTWTVQYGGVSSTYNTANPIITIAGSPASVLICLTIQTANCQSSYCDTIILGTSPADTCIADFNYQVDSTGLYLFFFDASFTNNGSIAVWSWTISDTLGNTIATSNLQNHAIPYPGNGIYNVCLTIATSTGCAATYCHYIFLQGGGNCYTTITYTPSNNINNTFDFNGSAYYNGAIANVTSWMWDFGDGAYSTAPNPSHTYSGSGTYTVCLTTTTAITNCTSTACVSVVVVDSSCIINVTPYISHVTVAGGNDGYIELTVTGGTPPYSFNWFNLNDTTGNVYNLHSGVYTVNISTSNPVCPSFTFTFQILEPYDSTNTIVDTLYTNVIDTCFGFVVDSFYIDSIFISGNNTVTVVWVFDSGGMSVPVYATYTYSYNGAQIVVLTINCNNGQKDLATYMGYIYISQTLNTVENTLLPELNLYPNPVQDLLNIDFGTSLPEHSVIRIYSGTGQEVYHMKLDGKTSFISLEVSNLKKGIYYVSAIDDKNNRITGKFIR